MLLPASFQFSNPLPGTRRTALFAAASLALLALGMAIWPDLFVFRRYLMLPMWARYFPSPVDAGTYLSAAALVPVTWGVTGLLRALRVTAAVVALAPLAVLTVVAIKAPQAMMWLPGVAFNYFFVGLVHLAVPAAALLALRWSVRTWIRL